MTPTASEQVQALLERVADGTVSPAQGTAIVAKFIVQCVSAVENEVTQNVIGKVVAHLRTERDKVQKHIGDAREPLYSIGQRDALDAAADELGEGEWRRCTT